VGIIDLVSHDPPRPRRGTDASQLCFGFDEAPGLEPPAASVVLPFEPAVFIRNPRARRYVLRLLPDGRPRVTIPRWGSKREAERFAAAQQPWIARERARLVARQARRPAPWRHGHAILVRGVRHRIHVTKGGAAAIALAAESTLSVIRPTTAPGDEDLQRLLSAWLWRLARRELPTRLRELATDHGLAVSAVSVRNQRARWGSCATTGRISLNWRLVQTPDAVRDYVLIHELMHLRQPNHSRRFWALVARACPDFQASRRWLREHEGELLDR
jgi:hypothetical protein